MCFKEYQLKEKGTFLSLHWHSDRGLDNRDRSGIGYSKSVLKIRKLKLLATIYTRKWKSLHVLNKTINASHKL